jgi:hypothetical protein
MCFMIAAISVVIIENKTSYNLEYVNSGYSTGWPVEDVKQSFTTTGEDGDVLIVAPGSVATQLWRVHQGGHYGKMIGNIFSLGIAQTKDHSQVEGYFAVKIRAPGKNYVICCGFNVGRNRCNTAGVQIRGEDGVLDEQGNIAGHGVDPTGKVTDVGTLARQVGVLNRMLEIEHEF